MTFIHVYLGDIDMTFIYAYVGEIDMTFIYVYVWDIDMTFIYVYVEGNHWCMILLNINMTFFITIMKVLKTHILEKRYYFLDNCTTRFLM